jgi:hypothetical protein
MWCIHTTECWMEEKENAYTYTYYHRRFRNINEWCKQAAENTALTLCLKTLRTDV